jgi:hypothetical protein
MTVEKDDDQSGMAIRFKKDEDFSGWYTEVSCQCPIDGKWIKADRVGSAQRSNVRLL